MAKRFSTGLPGLDQLVGGLLPGDSLLILASSPSHAIHLVTSTVEYAASARLPLLYLSVDGSFDRLDGSRTVRLSRKKDLARRLVSRSGEKRKKNIKTR